MLGKPAGYFPMNLSLKQSGGVFNSFIKKEFFQTLVPLVIRNLLPTFDLGLLMHKLNSFVLVSTLSSGALDNDAFIHTLSVSVYKQRTHPLSVFAFIGQPSQLFQSLLTQISFSVYSFHSNSNRSGQN